MVSLARWDWTKKEKWSSLVEGDEQLERPKSHTCMELYLAFAASFFFEWAIPGLFFFIFVSFTVDSIQMSYIKVLTMTGFEPQTSGVGSDCSTN